MYSYIDMWRESLQNKSHMGLKLWTSWELPRQSLPLSGVQPHAATSLSWTKSVQSFREIEEPFWCHKKGSSSSSSSSSSWKIQFLCDEKKSQSSQTVSSDKWSWHFAIKLLSKVNTSEKLIVLKFSNILKTIWLAWQSCFQRRGKVATLYDGCPDNFMVMAMILWHNLMAMM